MKTTILALGLVASITSFSVSARADTFGSGANQFDIDFTTIGNAGNAADTTGYGSVGYTYRIGTYGISQNQINAATASGLVYVTAGAWSGDLPAAYTNWYEAAAFVNWLNISKGFQPAYNLSWNGSAWNMNLWSVSDGGYNLNNLFRNSMAKYVLPSENEFYKAAYGKNDGSGYYAYSTGSDSAPIADASGTSAGTAVYGQQSPASVYQTGGLSSYGTMGQLGNEEQWMESAFDGVNDSVTDNRSIRSGYWGTGLGSLEPSYRYSSSADDDHGSGLSFRVASVEAIPEPSIYALMSIGLSGLMMVQRRKNTVH